MTYAALNTDVYGAALAGALSGMGVFARQPTDVDPTKWAGAAATAGAWAQEFDTIWNGSAVNTMIVQLIEQMSADWWASRASNTVSPTEFSVPINALCAAIGAAGTYVVAQGVTPTPIPSNQTVSSAFTTTNDPNQTIATSAELKDEATTIIDVQIIGKQVGATEAISTKIQYTYYRNGSGPQQAGNKTEIVPVTATLGLDASTFDVTTSGNKLIVRVTPEDSVPIIWKTVFTLTNT
jgi:hypothetical protein